MKLQHSTHETYNERNTTVLEAKVEEHWDEGASLLKHLPGWGGGFARRRDDSRLEVHPSDIGPSVPTRSCATPAA
jgi:hypothetical protein